MLFRLLLVGILSWKGAYSQESNASRVKPSINVQSYDVLEIRQHADPSIRQLDSVDRGFRKTLLWLNHFPRNETITMETERLFQKVQGYTKQHEFILNIEKIKPYIFISANGFLPGETLACRFLNAAGEIFMDVKLIPNPLNVTNKTGTVEIVGELVGFQPTLYKITCWRFDKDEKIDIQSISGKEKLNFSIHMSDKNHASFLYSPAVIGMKGGHSQVVFTRQSGERLQISFPWGEQLFEYLKGLKMYQPEEISNSFKSC